MRALAGHPGTLAWRALRLGRSQRRARWPSTAGLRKYWNGNDAFDFGIDARVSRRHARLVPHRITKGGNDARGIRVEHRAIRHRRTIEREGDLEPVSFPTRNDMDVIMGLVLPRGRPAVHDQIEVLTSGDTADGVREPHRDLKKMRTKLLRHIQHRLIVLARHDQYVAVVHWLDVHERNRVAVLVADGHLSGAMDQITKGAMVRVRHARSKRREGASSDAGSSRAARASKLTPMSLWSMQIPLPMSAWLPLTLAALAPLVLLAAVVPLSKRRSRGLATVLALRAVVLLAVGFATIAAVATVAVVETGIRELQARHAADLDRLVRDLERSPFGIAGPEAPLHLALFRARDASVVVAAAGTERCQSVCRVSLSAANTDSTGVRQRLVSSWPSRPGNASIASIGGRMILLLSKPLRDVRGMTTGTVVAGVDVQYLGDQAARTAWILLSLSYALLVLVGWSSWQQVSRSLAARIHAITGQIQAGSVEDGGDHLAIEAQELRELADSVTRYIETTLEQQKSSDERYRRLVDLAPDGVLMCSSTSIKFANPAALTLAGARSREDLIGVPIDTFLEFESPLVPGQPRSALRPARWKRLDGAVLHVEVAEIAGSDPNTVRRYGDGDFDLRQYLVRDVTDRHHREAALAHRAEHDSLTGLVNRACFESRLIELLQPGSASSRLGAFRQVAVLFIDLDAFKPVNDRYGHAAGDAVLVAVAQRLRDSTRGSDLVARLGGDEFAVLLEVRNHDEVRQVSDRILSSLDAPIAYDGQELRVGASIGIADTPVGGEENSLTAAELLRTADIAMYTAKQSGGNRAAA